MGDGMTNTRKTKSVMVRVRARKSFHDIREGNEATLIIDDIVQGWIDAGLMEVIDGGKGEAGQGSAEPAADAPVEG